jgi:type III secretion system low calcium response chaperone LcrH/SycD
MNAMQALAMADYPADSANPEHAAMLADLSNGQANSLYATAYHLAERGEHDKASALFALLGMYRPRDARYPLAVGVCFRKMGHYEDAIRMFARTMQLDPANHAPAFQVVECLLLLDRREQARQLLASMIEVAGSEGAPATVERAQAMLGFLEAAVH